MDRLNSISIIVPIYNGEKYIDRLVKSVIEQSYCNWQLILIDDGSTDSTPVICNKFKNKDMRIEYIHQNNKGVSAARNNGMEHARGEYVTFADVDDYFEVDFIEKLCKYANPDTIVRGDNEIKEDGVVLEGDETVNYILRHWSVWSSLYHKDMLTEICFREDIAIAEDLRFMVEIICRRKPQKMVLVKNGYNHVYNEQSAMHSNDYKKFYSGLIAELESVYELKKLGYDSQENNLVLNGTYYFLKSYWSQSFSHIIKERKNYKKIKKIIKDNWNEIYARRNITWWKYFMCFILLRIPWIGFIRNKIKRQ